MDHLANGVQLMVWQIADLVTLSSNRQETAIPVYPALAWVTSAFRLRIFLNAALDLSVRIRRYIQVS